MKLVFWALQVRIRATITELGRSTDKECYDDFLTVEMKKLVALVTRGQMLKSRINWRETITRNAVGMMLPSRLFNAQAYVHVAA